MSTIRKTTREVMEILIHYQKQSEENFMKHEERERQEEKEHDEKIIKCYIWQCNLIQCITHNHLIWGNYQPPHDQFN